MAFIDSTVVNVALPALQATFRATVVDVQWVVESYGLFLGALILVGGSLGDLFGRRLIFVMGVIIFRRGFCRLRSGFEHSSIDNREERSRYGSRAPRARQPCDYQCIVRREEPGTGDWDVVWFHGYHRCDWASSWRLAC